jgi:hypothetical protein
MSTDSIVGAQHLIRFLGHPLAGNLAYRLQWAGQPVRNSFCVLRVFSSLSCLEGKCWFTVR